MEPAAAAVFGDGNPKNGIEDDRVEIDETDRLTRQLRATGIITCGGLLRDQARVRGSATVLDISDFADDKGYSVIATAAHIFFEPKTHKRRKDCWFHPYLGSKYRRPIEFSRVVMGDYVPRNRVDLSSFSNDWAFAWLGSNMEPFGTAMKPAILNPDDIPLVGKYARQGRFAVAAYNEQQDKVTVNVGCQPVNPTIRLEKAARGKVVFTDCEGKAGASGGAVAIAPKNEFRLIGIYAGHYWRTYRLPDGTVTAPPQDGAPFSHRTNSNFFRVFDQEMVDAIRDLVGD